MNEKKHTHHLGEKAWDMAQQKVETELLTINGAKNHSTKECQDCATLSANVGSEVRCSAHSTMEWWEGSTQAFIEQFVKHGCEGPCEGCLADTTAIMEHIEGLLKDQKEEVRSFVKSRADALEAESKILHYKESKQHNYARILECEKTLKFLSLQDPIT